jgi:type IV pilus assembly protein PilV
MSMNGHTSTMSKISRHATPSKSRRLISGFTLLEVLVVIVVLSFGLLGIAGVQANTAKYKINSWARSTAAVQLSALSESIRANYRSAGIAGGGASAYVVDDDWDTQQTDPLTLSRDCASNTCDAAQRADYDLTIWRQHVRNLFPQGAVVLSGDANGGVNATIAWFDKQFVDTTGTLERTQVCVAGLNAAQQANCCPASLGDPAEPGVRCTNVSFVP